MSSVLYGQAEAGRYRWTDRSFRAPLRRPQEEVVVAVASPQLNTTLLESLARQRLGTDRSIYVPDDPERGLGPVLAWADQQAVVDVDVVAATAGGVLARQATYFAEPLVRTWQLDGADLVQATADALSPRPTTSPAAELVDALLDADLDVVVEDGVTRGEVNGLEVARIVDGSQLEVGVGAADRELTALLHTGLTPSDQVLRAADIVRQHRHPDAAPHPLNQLARERWLRTTLCRDPEIVGLRVLRPADTPWPRPNLGDRGIAAAFGETTDVGQRVVVACSVGIDLDLVPRAADIRAALDPTAMLWLVVPERDDHPLTRRLATRLHDPARVVAVPWP